MDDMDLVDEMDGAVVHVVHLVHFVRAVHWSKTADRKVLDRCRLVMF